MYVEDTMRNGTILPFCLGLVMLFGTLCFNMVEVPDQVNAMIDAFVRHHV